MESIAPVMVDTDLDQYKGVRGYAFHEVVLAENQPEFQPLTVAVVHKMTVPVVSRWRPTAEELELLVQGADVMLTVITGGGGMQPVNLQIVARDRNPEVPVV